MMTMMTAGGLLRANRSLELQLDQSLRENRNLQLSVDQLEFHAGRLEDRIVDLEDQLGRLHADIDEELAQLLPDFGSVAENSHAKAVAELAGKARQLQEANDILRGRIAQQPEDRCVGDELRMKIGKLESERETLLEREIELRRALELSRGAAKTDTATATEEPDVETRPFRDTRAPMKSGVHREGEFGAKTDEEKRRLLFEVEKLVLKAQRAEEEFDVTLRQLKQRSEKDRWQSDTLNGMMSDLELASPELSGDPFVGQENERLGGEIEALKESLTLDTDENQRHCYNNHHNRQHQCSHSCDSEFGTAYAYKDEPQVIECGYSIFFPYKNLLRNVDINFLLIILHRIIFYAIFVKTVLHVN